MKLYKKSVSESLIGIKAWYFIRKISYAYCHNLYVTIDEIWIGEWIY
jgi:hypothetical protein